MAFKNLDDHGSGYAWRLAGDKPLPKVLAWHLLSAKPLSETMWVYAHLHCDDSVFSWM